MPLCGFDKQMLDGLDSFYRGLARAVIRKSKEKNVLVKDAMEHQISETRKFLFDIDNYYYQHLEGKTGKPMLELVHYIQRM